MPVRVYESNAAFWQAAAADFAQIVNQAVRERGEAAGDSGDGKFAAFHSWKRCWGKPDIAWDRVPCSTWTNISGMLESHPASFRRFLIERLCASCGRARFMGYWGDADDVGAELERVTRRCWKHISLWCAC